MSVKTANSVPELPQRILVASDLHLNERNRLSDHIRNLHLIEQQLAKVTYNAYVIPGDVFDKRRPTPLELKTFATHIANCKVDVIYLVEGNHDRISKNLSALDWTILEKRIKLVEELKETFGGVRTLITHKTISESKMGPNNFQLEGTSMMELLKDYDFVISGHIHKPQVIKHRGLTCLVPGSIERVDFGERLESKYFYDIELANRKINITRIPCILRPMFLVEYFVDEKVIKVNGEVTPLADLKAKLDGSIIQLKLIGVKDTIRKINYQKLISTFSAVHSLDLKVSYISKDLEVYNTVKGAPITTISAINCNQIDVKELLTRLQVYCNKQSLDNTVFKLAKKVIEEVEE